MSRWGLPKRALTARTDRIVQRNAHFYRRATEATRRQLLYTAHGSHGTAILADVNEAGAEALVVVLLRAGFPRRTSAEAPPTRNTGNGGPDPPAARARPVRPPSPVTCFSSVLGRARGCAEGDVGLATTVRQAW